MINEKKTEDLVFFTQVFLTTLFLEEECFKKQQKYYTFAMIKLVPIGKK